MSTFIVHHLREGTVDNTGLVTGLPGGCGDGTVVARSGGVDSNPVAIHIAIRGRLLGLLTVFLLQPSRIF